ncbi:MAG: HAMP domain-containing sensor histidine kinase, partial [Anaeromyxobacteraceae bacterium]
ASDFAAVFLGAWRAAGGPDGQAAVAYFMGAFELVLLFAAVTLPRSTVAAFGAVALAFLGAVVWRAGLGGSGGVLVLVTFAAFAVAVTWAGMRMVDLAVRTAAEAAAAAAARAHGMELRRASEALREAQIRAEVLSELIVHDLRGPLATVSLALQAMGRPPEGQPVARESWDIAREEVRRLSDMVGDLLVVSRLEKGLRADRAPVPVRAFVEGVVRGAEVRAREVSARLSWEAPDATVEVDGPLLRRLLDNLLANAFRHVRAGDPVAVLARVEDGVLHLAARNGGPPVPERIAGHLFEKDVTLARGWDNAGLGLYLCRLVAEAHGGRIALVPRPGWNVSFEAELPLVPAP